MSEMTVDLPESLTIHRIEEIFGDLKISFQTDSEEIKISAAKVDTIDTSGLQTLLKFVVEATDAGKSVSWDSPSETLVSSAKQIGLEVALKLS